MAAKAAAKKASQQEGLLALFGNKILRLPLCKALALRLHFTEFLFVLCVRNPNEGMLPVLQLCTSTVSQIE